MAEPRTIQWRTGALAVDFVVNADGVFCLSQILPSGTEVSASSGKKLFKSCELPLVSLRLAGEGNSFTHKTSKAAIGSCVSLRLQYETHAIQKDDTAGTETFEVTSTDETTNVSVTTRLTIFGSIPVIRSKATVTNTSSTSNVTVTQLASLTIGGLASPSSTDAFGDYNVLYATNTWFREAQWTEHTLPDLGIDNNGICELPDGHVASQATFRLGSRGSFSTGSYLPMGILKSKDDTDVWLWQVESSGSWSWELGDFKNNVYLTAGGPNSVEHGWKAHLAPGESFTTVPVSVCRTTDGGGIESAFAALTDYRRRIRRPHADMDNVPIVFNDYMNCLMGDPDEEKITALLDPVAESGAEYFIVDCGWYADDSNWWDDVGLWEPSPKRFPSGFKTLLNKIRSRGLIPGLWLEPEVVGVRSAVASRLPEEAFFHSSGQRTIEKGRYQLDYRHPAVITWMNSVVDNLVTNYGAGFFKFDYNIEVLHGPDAPSQGAAHLAHQRAYLAWVHSLFDRHPSLVIESCSSGAQRMDYAMLAVHPLQSTSDQQDPVLYAAIAAAAPTAVTPEQSATWAYPQAEWSDEINALTVINSLLGRVYLSGRLDKMGESQLELVREGMRVYEGIKGLVKTAHAGVVSVGMPDAVCARLLQIK
ncbi:hypothetical protein N0V88_006288 [Collariella sp. IMI 366227]|nr:hypothetical protein N0V88_006288 [Collariella sp. IMI 366227]